MLLLEVVPSLASSQAAGVMSRLDKMRTRLVGGEPAGLPALQSEGDLPALPGPALTSPAGLGPFLRGSTLNSRWFGLLKTELRVLGGAGPEEKEPSRPEASRTDSPVPQTGSGQL